MSDQPLPRRSFLKTAAAGAAGAVFATAAPAYSYSRIQGANARVRVGVVGFSDRFRGSLLPAMQAHAKALNFEFVAVSDLWSVRREAGVAARPPVKPGGRLSDAKQIE